MHSDETMVVLVVATTITQSTTSVATTTIIVGTSATDASVEVTDLQYFRLNCAMVPALRRQPRLLRLHVRCVRLMRPRHTPEATMWGAGVARGRMPGCLWWHPLHVPVNTPMAAYANHRAHPTLSGGHSYTQNVR